MDELDEMNPEAAVDPAWVNDEEHPLDRGIAERLSLTLDRLYRLGVPRRGRPVAEGLRRAYGLEDGGTIGSQLATNRRVLTPLEGDRLDALIHPDADLQAGLLPREKHHHVIVRQIPCVDGITYTAWERSEGLSEGEYRHDIRCVFAGDCLWGRIGTRRGVDPDEDAERAYRVITALCPETATSTIQHGGVLIVDR